MLINASHPEETRVVILDSEGNLEDYDFRSSTKETIKGNIYLAKVARVEPSLQAAFVDYGGNRHGFLSFAEIHPDYFRIPVSDRDALTKPAPEIQEDEGASSETPKAHQEGDALPLEQRTDPADAEAAVAVAGEEAAFQMPLATVGGDFLPLDEDEDELAAPKTPPLHNRYKIQEVIHKNQILLVQVSKEERGGKGAALTSYLSLAGRYCVLMPNSPRSGGISRKINVPEDRKRLRDILESFEIPEGMGLIVRTAGKERTRAELRRDAQYLMRLWDDIRETTLKSEAPALINREDNIIKRALRDLYTKEITDIYVEGEGGYKAAKDFMKTLMPSHSKRIQRFKMESLPLFHHFNVESQIDGLHDPEVRLPSGGSLVIQPTEALVSIDINSGKATKERHIEETAKKTNLEAAVEIARQVRLRDLAGLIVIDFIDMDEPRHTAAVEKKIREAFRHDRARIQMGRIGPFGLLEMSRQRLAPSLLERSTHPCQHCHATGLVRSTESFSLHVLRLLEEEGGKKTTKNLKVETSAEVIFYLMNHKRDILSDIEKRHDLTITFAPSTTAEQSCLLTSLEPPAEGTQISEKKAPSSRKAKDTSSSHTKVSEKSHKSSEAAHRPKSRQRKKALPEGASEDVSMDSGSLVESSASPKKPPSSAVPDSPPSDDTDKGEAHKRKRRPRRRSGRRVRRPQTNDTKEAASSPPTPMNDADHPAEGAKALPQTLVNLPLNNAQPAQKLGRAPVNEGGKETSSEGREQGKATWWRRLLD